jgi:hypothetical protein
LKTAATGGANTSLSQFDRWAFLDSHFLQVPSSFSAKSRAPGKLPVQLQAQNGTSIIKTPSGSQKSAAVPAPPK